MHPIESLYIMAEGHAKFFDGNIEKPLKAGDIILIPRGAKHGFIGAGENGYWALSIQMEQRGLYEDPDQPLVDFQEQSSLDLFDQLDQANNSYILKFSKNPIFKTLKEIKQNKNLQDTFLDYLQILSDNFQKLLLLRSSLCNQDDFNKIFSYHLKDEFGHDEQLRNSRKNFKEIKDPIFESLCLWFNHKILQLDKIEQLYLINRIVEKSADEFYTRSYPYLSDLKIDHFKEHAEHDSNHCEIGIELLKVNINHKNFKNLMILQEEAWEIIEAQYERLSTLIMKKRSKC